MGLILYGSSSVGRALVSKTRCREFESLETMKKLKILADIQDSYNELVHKVSWPTKSELANSAVVVMFASLIIAIVIFAMDQCIDKIMHLIYGGL